MYESSAENRERILQIQKELNEKYKSEEMKAENPQNQKPQTESEKPESESKSPALSLEKDDLVLLFIAFLLLCERNSENSEEVDSLLLILACLVLL